MKNLLYIALVAPFFVSCQVENSAEQNLEQLDQKSAREVVLSTKTVGDSTYHITTQKIWANNQIIGEKIDTLVTAKGPITDSANQSVPIYVTIQ